MTDKNTAHLMRSALQYQLLAFLIVLICYFINGPAYPFIGNLIWLPLGAMSLCFLLFGFEVIIAVLLATQLAEFWFHGEPFFDQMMLLRNISGVLGPILAIASMRFFKLSNFFDGGKIVFQHLVFLAILTALLNTLIAFFVTSFIVSNNQDIGAINATQFLKNFLIGDILGCLIVLFIAALIVVPFIKYFFPKYIPKEEF